MIASFTDAMTTRSVNKVYLINSLKISECNAKETFSSSDDTDGLFLYEMKLSNVHELWDLVLWSIPVSTLFAFLSFLVCGSKCREPESSSLRPAKKLFLKSAQELKTLVSQAWFKDSAEGGLFQCVSSDLAYLSKHSASVLLTKTCLADAMAFLLTFVIHDVLRRATIYCRAATTRSSIGGSVCWKLFDYPASAHCGWNK